MRKEESCEEETRRNEKREIDRIRKNPKTYLEKIKTLTEEKESHKCKNSQPPKEINICVRLFAVFLLFYFLVNAILKPMNDTEEFRNNSKMHDEARRNAIRLMKLRESVKLEKKRFAQREVEASHNSRVGEETRVADGTSKERIDSRRRQSNVIGKFATERLLWKRRGRYRRNTYCTDMM